MGAPAGSTANIYLTMDLFDEAEKVYTLSESLENANIDEGGYRIDKFQIPLHSTDYLISFANIGTINFLILRADVGLIVKLNATTATPMTLWPSLPTMLAVVGITRIYISNVTDDSVELNVFSAVLSD